VYSLDVRTRLALLLSISFAVHAQDEPKDLLMRVSQKVMDAVNRLPKYVCTLTIDRAEYQTNGLLLTRSCDSREAEKKAGRLKRRLLTSDRLRLDVAVGTSHEIFGTTNEMYSWVGDNRFDNRGLFDLVRQGAISTGTFSSLLVSIFGEDRASFSYHDDLTVDGRLLAEFGFRIPLEKSNYLYLFGNDRRQQVRAGAEGTFLVDVKTFDLVRLTVRHALPPKADACETSQTLDYGRVSLGGSDFLLATEGHLNILSLNDEMENHLVYSACHEFTGQSTLTFEPPLERIGSVSDTSDPVVPVFALPLDLPFKLAFTEPIDTAVVAAGDPIRARLTTAIRARSKVLVPEGAIVSARIVKAEHLYGPNQSFVMAVQLESVVVGGTSRPIKARRDYGVQRFGKGAGRLTQRVYLGLLNTTQDRDIGIFEFRDAAPNYVIKSGLESSWLTLAP
jgi:hypothetical protein